MFKLIMTIVFSSLLAAPSFAGDSSELSSKLMDRIESGCEKMAERSADERTENYFNMNFWAGGNVGAGSMYAVQQSAEVFKRFERVKCINYIVETLELKVGYGPWQ